MSIDIDNADSYDQTLASISTPYTLIDFWASWCGPCRALSPILESIAEDNADSITLVKVDADAAPELVTRYGVSSIPTIKVLDQDGTIVKTIVGAKPRSVLEADLQNYLS